MGERECLKARPDRDKREQPIADCGESHPERCIPARELGDSLGDGMGAIATPAFTQKSTISGIYFQAMSNAINISLF